MMVSYTILILAIVLTALAAAVVIMLTGVFSTNRFLVKNYDESIERHYSEVQNIYKQMRGWRHDYNNHLNVMKLHLEHNRYEELAGYISNLGADLDRIDEIVKSGNFLIDAILNSKLSLARTFSIDIYPKAEAPEKLKISDIDICIILANLLDNALMAAKEIPEGKDRFIRVYISTFKNQLYISITNTYEKTIIRKGSQILSRKGSSYGHGLNRIDSVVNKYRGYVNRQYEDDIFATEIMLPL